MRRDMELVRLVLLKVESFEIPLGGFVVVRPREQALAIEGYNEEQVSQHLAMLIDGSFVDGKLVSTGGAFRIRGLTWSGHEFIDTIRSPEIWRRTKEGLGKVGGWSVELAWQLAKGYGKQLAKEKLGIDL